jgi:hypothetical protein
MHREIPFSSTLCNRPLRARSPPRNGTSSEIALRWNFPAAKSRSSFWSLHACESPRRETNTGEILMKIQDAGLKHPPFDLAVPLAEYFISTGHFFKYVDPSTIKPPSVMTFGLLESPSAAVPPSISHSCHGCTLVGYTSSHKGTAHKTPVLHCGQSSLPDEATAEAYVQAFKRWSRAAQQQKEEPQTKRVFFVPAVGA